MDSFDLATFIANLAARLLGDRATKDETLEFNWRSPTLHHAGTDAANDNCVFLDITFQFTTMNASFGSLYRRSDSGSTYFTAQLLTQESIQDHFGEEVDTAGTNADVLARSMANELRAGNIRSTDNGIFLCYDGFCGERPVICKGLDTTEIPDKATKLILLGGQHEPSPDGLTVNEDDIKRITEAIKSKWQKHVVVSNKEEPAPSSVKDATEDNAAAESTKATEESIKPSPEKLPATASAPQPDPAKKRKPNNKIKSKVKKKKKRTGTLSFVD